mmetsp:Transcript_19087/g.28788  ORF Transcript_19087/g.28788 Transcript_19087/m.28788 type:complete len:628 (+) Transcript_19087:111-1994(+)|eukprot:CAMPEP_0178913106 /NCGR_PEP_ID=MMETSP0786-20121207/10649_1 /TAXON_ID=186022 /ORGANISM="Thalassionema frauenfeldii, Strain CCMP 1798" /LENGTH=627 /DNA_ID=CAMNT_0020585793 /DNA_START=170 /DNA_END=2053 /DNA_ORIENTATION=-
MMMSAKAFSFVARRHAAKVLTGTAAAALVVSQQPTPAVVALSSSSSSRSHHATTALAMSAKDDNENNVGPPFTTWTFDKHCETMEFNTVADVKLEFGESSEDADLVVIGIYGPPKKDDDDDDDEEKKDDDDDDTVPPVELTGMAKEFDDANNGWLTQILEDNYKDFKHGGAVGKLTPPLGVASSNDKKLRRVVLLGLGPAKAVEKKDDDDDDDDDTNLMSAIGGAVAKQCDELKKVKTCAVVLPVVEGSYKDLSTEFYNSLYSDNRYRTGDKVVQKASDLETVTLVTSAAGGGDEASLLTQGQQLAKGVTLTKDIVNAPHNVLNSESLANVAKRIAEESNGRITCTILNKEECEERGMGAYLGVARGSETQPQFIHLTYKGEGPVQKKVGIVGKGLLFDTGGYNIKTQMMELMKFDCGGSAAVLGAARAVGELAPEGVEAHFIVAACENMINERAYVPSDVLTASNGKTIEVLNTDAEGRLTLADALVYADKEVGCDAIIELSTLTGACMISLGKEVCGVWTNDNDLAKSLESCSKDTQEKSWRMPMEKSYNKLLESKIADMSNLGGPYGGAITAALFLQNFVSPKKPFAHIDIAGPVWDDKVGATGFGAKLVSEWIARQGQSKKEE